LFPELEDPLEVELRKFIEGGLNCELLPGSVNKADTRVELYLAGTSKKCNVTEAELEYKKVRIRKSLANMSHLPAHVEKAIDYLERLGKIPKEITIPDG